MYLCFPEIFLKECKLLLSGASLSHHSNCFLVVSIASKMPPFCDLFWSFNFFFVYSSDTGQCWRNCWAPSLLHTVLRHLGDIAPLISVLYYFLGCSSSWMYSSSSGFQFQGNGYRDVVAVGCLNAWLMFPSNVTVSSLSSHTQLLPYVIFPWSQMLSSSFTTFIVKTINSVWWNFSSFFHYTISVVFFDLIGSFHFNKYIILQYFVCQ